jgi:hypothetical protein
MRKLKLDLDNLQVDTFEPSSEPDGASTIFGYVNAAVPPAEVTNSPSCPTNGCGTCYQSCWNTCAVTCQGTTGDTETQWDSCNVCAVTIYWPDCWVETQLTVATVAGPVDGV